MVSKTKSQWNFYLEGGHGRGGKRGGAREHCSQKEIDRIDHGRRIKDKSTIILVKRVIYLTFTDGPNRMISSSFP